MIDSRPSNIRGIGYMLVATLLFTGMGAIARHVSERIHPFEVVFFRIAFGFVLLLPLVLRYGLQYQALWTALRARRHSRDRDADLFRRPHHDSIR
jgi:drug/metabolite transporter (DMT)-like permease